MHAGHLRGRFPPAWFAKTGLGTNSEKLTALGGEALIDALAVILSIFGVDFPPYGSQTQVQSEGKNGGTTEYTTEPKKMDGMLRAAWAKIYAGNQDDNQGLVDNFMAKYGRLVYVHEEIKVNAITEDRVYDTFMAAKASVAGLDSWEPAELKLMSRRTCRWIARLYNLIEDTGKWPRSSCVAKAAFVYEEGAPHGKVMSYRPLLIMSTLYRKWAAIRLISLTKWISMWAMGTMFAGIGSQGAEDAWYLAAINLEDMVIRGVPYCGGTADIMKFFDQIPRELIYALCKKAGMPRDILETYAAFQENLVIRNGVGTSVGEQYTKKASIPQGCPLSMMIVALLMRPWLCLMRECKVEGWTNGWIN